MSDRKHDPEARLDRVLAGIRDDGPDPSAVRGAGERVWQRLSAESGASGEPARSVETIHGCEDVRTLLPSYLDGSLGEAKTLLVADHARECVTCRRALRDARAGAPAIRRGAAPVSRRHAVVWWAAAAASVLAAVVAGSYLYREGAVDPARSAVRVRTVEGALYRAAGNWSSSVASGDEIPGGQVFRTAKGSRAVVRLADGSDVELNERSELSVTGKRSGTTLHLTRGSIIVQAAKQGSKHLWVATSDCRVSVTGTIFSVNHGTKGSRVSVIEGEVHVERAGGRDVLLPGDQVSTTAMLRPVPLATEIAWSRDLDRHLAILAELTKLRRDLDQLPRPALRHDKRLLDLAPPDTVVYAAIPNVGSTLGEAHRIFHDRLAQSPVLRDWWSETMAPSGADEELEDAIASVRAFSEQLGDEIAVTVSSGRDGRFDGVLVLAPLVRPAEFPGFLRNQLARLEVPTGGAPVARIIEDPSSEPRSSDRRSLLVWVRGDLLAASPSLEGLQRLQADLDGGTVSAFASSPFRASLARSYDEGTTFLVGVDLEKVLAHSTPTSSSEALRRAGLLDVRHLIVEGKETDGKAVYGAALTFDQPRRGIASWLAAPAPMGSLEFISPDATLVAAFAAKNPVGMAEDLFDILRASDPGFGDHLAEFERTHGVNVVRDLAAPLGGEFAFALDGPVLPQPAWKAVLEVYDPAGLQRAIEWAVTEINGASIGQGTAGLRVEPEEVGGRAGWVIRSDRFPVEVHYAFVDGYMVATPARALLDAAIGNRASGATLPQSSRFTSLLPQDGHVNFSALVYQNLGSLVAPLASTVGAAGSAASPEQRDAMSRLLSETPASLVYAYGEPDRILAASTRPGGLFGNDLQMLMGLDGLLRAQGEVRRVALSEAAPEGAARP